MLSRNEDVVKGWVQNQGAGTRSNRISMFINRSVYVVQEWGPVTNGVEDYRSSE